MKITKAKAYQNYLNGYIEGEGVSVSKKCYKDAKHFYESVDETLDEDTVMYEVYMCKEEEKGNPHSLNWGLSVLKPVLVNQECNMTRGHFHADTSCAEIYFGLAGKGMLMYMDEDGNCFGEEIEVGSIHYISGKLAHRLINTSQEELRVGACWSLQAGYDYERVEQNPFTTRVFKENDKIIYKESK